MIDNPKLFNDLGQSPNFKYPSKKIFDPSGAESFQSSVAMDHIVKLLDQILTLTSLTECPAGALDAVVVSAPTASAASHKDTVKVLPRQLPPTFETALEPCEDVQAVTGLLAELSKFLDETPPFPGPRRYGNLACRDWHRKFEESVLSMLATYVGPLYQGPNKAGFLNEISYYLLNSFGSKLRLDYGTGHELSFLAFLGTLWMTDVLCNMTGKKFLTIFCKYYDLTRKLILTYTLEPAGSHGVWGLDDHFHLIYLIGASQLSDPSQDEKHQIMTIPSTDAVLDKNIVGAYKTKNLYFNAVAFIYKVKHGPFWETSPLLYDISGVKSWNKILLGLLKMYKTEVLKKFPVIQHFWFGGVFFPWIDIHGVDLPVYQTLEQDEKSFNPVTVAPSETEDMPKVGTSAPWAAAHRNLLNLTKRIPDRYRKLKLPELNNSSNETLGKKR